MLKKKNVKKKKKRSTHQILLCSKANEAQETNKLRHLKLRYLLLTGSVVSVK